MKAELTKTQIRIIEASKRGYYVSDDGRLFGPRGELQVKKYGKQKYPTFSTNWGGVFSIPTHLFAAYIFYGEEAFGQIVRHLDADTLNISRENIVLGTHSENNLDKPKRIRVRSARLARAHQGIVPLNAGLTKAEVNEIRNAYKTMGKKKAPNGFNKALCLKYDTNRGTICKIVNGEYYASYLH